MSLASHWRLVPHNKLIAGQIVVLNSGLPITLELQHKPPDRIHKPSIEFFCEKVVMQRVSCNKYV